jgi:predicted GNAT family acetyltransferase
MAAPEFEVRDNAQRARYEALVDGDVAGFAAYRDTADARVFTHTQVADDYEGQGVGSRLARAALDDVRENGGKVVARCPFITAWLQRHPDYQDLIRPR